MVLVNFLKSSCADLCVSGPGFIQHCITAIINTSPECEKEVVTLLLQGPSHLELCKIRHMCQKQISINMPLSVTTSIS